MFLPLLKCLSCLTVLMCYVMLHMLCYQVMDTVDNVTKDCLSNCEDQVNDLFVTTSNYPNRKTFKDREEFCILGKKLLTATCKFPKRLPLTADFPDLCETLEALPDFLVHPLILSPRCDHFTIFVGRQ